MGMNIKTKLICQKLFAEFLCSLIFGFAVYSAVLNTKAEESAAPSTAVGLTVAFSAIALIYTFCDHCAAHFNPAITIAAICTGKLEVFLGIGYVVVQLIGFFIASLLVVLCFPYGYNKTLDLITPLRVSDDITGLNLFWTEFILTFILVFVAFEVGINAVREPGVTLYVGQSQVDRSKFAPLTIGCTLGFLAFLAST